MVNSICHSPLSMHAEVIPYLGLEEYDIIMVNIICKSPLSLYAETIPQVGLEQVGVFLAGFLQRQECASAPSVVLAARAAADLEDGHRVADLLLRAVGVERYL